MKYQNHEITPENINISDYHIKTNHNFTFIYPKQNLWSKSQGIIYYRTNSQNFVVFGNISHAHLFDVLFKKLKIPKDTKFVDCLVGSFRPSSQKFEWYKTEHVTFGSKKGFVVLNKINSGDSKFVITKVLEGVLSVLLTKHKIHIPKINLKKRTEINRSRPKFFKRIFKKPI